MGTYTQIASLYRPRAGGGRGKDIERERSEHTSDSPFVCPECDDGSAFEAVCERCKLTTVPSEGLVRLAPVRQVNPIRRSPAMLLFAAFCVLAVPVSLGAGRLSGGELNGLTQMTMGVIGVFLLATFALARVQLRRRRRWITGERHTPAQLPEVARSPVAVEGRLAAMVAGALVVEGSDGRCRVRVPEEARAFDANGRTRVLHIGDRVDVVGVGARMRGAGEGYRDEAGDFVFEGPVQLVAG